jgi:cytochrome d ubiquinol oxidase subunit II
MTQPVLDLVGIWIVILGLGVFFYVLLDGFDLGVGILYGLAPDTLSRNLMMNSIAPIWDGNETWLILGSVGLLAAFPLAFAIVIPAVYSHLFGKNPRLQAGETSVLAHVKMSACSNIGLP